MEGSFLRSAQDKAADIYKAAVNTRKRHDQIQMDKMAMDRRMKEAAWILKGLEKQRREEEQDAAEDEEEQQTHDILGTKVTQGAAVQTETEKYSNIFSKLRRSFRLSNQRDVKAGTHNAAGVSAQKEKGPVSKMMTNLFKQRDVKKVYHIRNERFVFKEGIARRLVHRHRGKERDEFLVKNAEHIRMLQNLNVELRRGKMPPHHMEAVTGITDSVPHLSQEEALQISEDNLRNYHIEPPQRIIEELRSNEEVAAEDKKRWLYRPGSRWHNFRGQDKIYPLRHIPESHVLLHSEHAVRDYHPEATLLPDKSIRERKQIKAAVERKKERLPLRKIRKSRLDMSRKQFRLASEEHYAAPEISTTLEGYVFAFEEDGLAATAARQQKLLNATSSTEENQQQVIATVSNRVQSAKQLAQQRLLEDNDKHEEDIDISYGGWRSPVGSAGPNSVRISSRFKWKRRNFVDDNSVYDHRHGDIIFEGDEPADDEQSKGSIDSNTVVESVRYHLLPEDKQLPPSIRALLGSDKNPNRNINFQSTISTHTFSDGATLHHHHDTDTRPSKSVRKKGNYSRRTPMLGGTMEEQTTNTNDDDTSSLNFSETTYTEENSQHFLTSEGHRRRRLPRDVDTKLHDWESIDAVRSNYLSECSSNNLPVVKVNLKRHRVKNHLHVKGLMLESRKTQNLRVSSKRAMKLKRAAMGLDQQAKTSLRPITT